MRHGGGQPDPPRPRRERPQAGDSQRQLVAALGAGEGVDLVHHDAGQGFEELRRVGQGEQHGEAFRRCKQDRRRRGALAGAAVGGGVAGAGLDADGQAHLLHRAGQVAGDVGGERLQRADVDGVEAGAGVGREIDQAGQEAGEGLATSGRRDQQDAFVRPGGVEHRHLVRTRGPAPGSEPGGEWFR